MSSVSEAASPAPAERFPLSAAVDALGESARQAGRPGLVWIAGFFYPAIGIGIDSAWQGPFAPTFDGPRQGLSDAARSVPVYDFLLSAYSAQFLVPFVAVLFLPLFRLVAGLARAGSADAWQGARDGRRSPRLRALWRLGSGLTLSTYGLWLQLVFMQLLAFLVLLVPIILAARELAPGDQNFPGVILVGAIAGPFVLVFALYMLALSVLGQLGLQSLAENRRGVSSALLHAWRIMRHDPRATTRAVIAELVLLAVTLGSGRMFGGLIGDFHGSEQLVFLFQVTVLGFAGVVRAGYWARTYRALGGLTPADGVPGLARG